jgi:hypothetical protein
MKIRTKRTAITATLLATLSVSQAHAMNERQCKASGPHLYKGFHQIVFDSLRAPSTAHIPGWDSDLVGFRAVWDAENKTCNATMTASVDSQNGFGAMVRDDISVDFLWTESKSWEVKLVY